MNNKFLMQIVKFGLVGVLNTIVNYVIYAAVIAILGTDYYVLGNVLGFIISVLHAYLWQNKIVFKEDSNLEKRVWWKVLLKTYIAYSFTGLFLTNVLSIIWLDYIRIDMYMGTLVDLAKNFNIVLTSKEMAAYLAPFLNMFVTIPINFLINKFWAYNQKEKK